MTNRFKSRRSKRQRWSRNAVLAKARKRMEPKSPQEEMPVPDCVHKIGPARFDVKINLERKDGSRIQFTCHRMGNRIYHNGNLVAAKSFFRRIGEIANLWSMA